MLKQQMDAQGKAVDTIVGNMRVRCMDTGSYCWPNHSYASEMLIARASCSRWRRDSLRIRSKKPTKQRSTSLDFSALCSSNLTSTLQLTPRKRGQEPVRVPVHFERPQHLLQMRVLLCGHQLKLRHGQATRLESGGQPPTGVEQPGRLLPSAYRLIPGLTVERERGEPR